MPETKPQFDAFEWAFQLIIGLEGGFTRDSKDPGNWTSGRIGKGELKGTKYGISAASYPTLDIPNITIEQAKGIYRRDYWDALRCGAMTRRLAILVFDSGVQHGVAQASEWLHVPLEFSTYLSRRLLAYANLTEGDAPMKGFEEGWMHRLGGLLEHLADYPDSVDTIIFNDMGLWPLLGAAFTKRLDGRILWRERPRTDGGGGKIDLRLDTSSSQGRQA